MSNMLKMLRGISLLLLTPLPVLCAITLALTPIYHANAQTKTTYEKNDIEFAPIEEGKPDVTGLWFHIEQGQTALANAEFGRLRNIYPSWKPSADLQAALAQINQPRNKQTETSSGKLSTLSKQTTEPVATPLEVFASKSPRERKITNQEFDALLTIAERTDDVNSLLLMGWTAIERGQLTVAQSQFNRVQTLAKSEIAKRSARQGIETILTLETEQAISQGNMEKLVNLLAENKENGVVLSLIETEAWNSFNDKGYQRAYEFFALAKNLEGQYLSLNAQNKSVQANALACAISTENFLRRCADGLAQQQLLLYEDKKYKGSIRAAQRLSNIRRLTEGELSLLGWAAAKNGSVAIATEAFEKVLALNPNDKAVADELVRLNSQNTLKLRQLSAKFSIVNTSRQAQINNNAWPRKQFLLSYNNADKRAINAQTKDAFSVVSGMTTRSRSGQAGLGNFDVLTSYVGVGDIYKEWQWQVTLDYKQFYTGQAPPNVWLGDNLVGSSFAPVSNNITGFEDKGIRAEVSYQGVGFNVYANAEYGMFDQPVNTALTGQVSATWFLPDVTLAATVFRYPKGDSMLSQTGSFNARNENAWGYVLEDGVRGLAAYQIAPNWSAAGTIQISALHGDLVEDNKALMLRGDLSYDIGAKIGSSVADIIDYWRIGPFASYSGYDNNSSGFTYGNGGYFSPNYFVSIGLYSELLTLEALEWQFKLSNALAISRLEQAADSRFPLLNFPDEGSDASPEFTLPYSKDTGLSGNFLAEAQYRISPEWIIAAYLGKAFAVEYQAFEAGIQVRWRGGKGNGVTSDELMLSSPKLKGFAL